MLTAGPLQRNKTHSCLFHSQYASCNVTSLALPMADTEQLSNQQILSHAKPIRLNMWETSINPLHLKENQCGNNVKNSHPHYNNTDSSHPISYGKRVFQIPLHSMYSYSLDAVPSTGEVGMKDTGAMAAQSPNSAVFLPP